MSEQYQPTTVNGAIIDSITITNTKVLAEAPAMAMGSLYQTIGNSVAMAAANAVYAQQQANITYQAATTLGVTKLFSADTSSISTNSLTKSNTDTQEQIQAQINALNTQLEHLKATQQPGGTNGNNQ
jgi:high-affinity K+ transport system ATPase subunit B